MTTSNHQHSIPSSRDANVNVGDKCYAYVHVYGELTKPINANITGTMKSFALRCKILLLNTAILQSSAVQSPVQSSWSARYNKRCLKTPPSLSFSSPHIR
jgi:hypothetical protein